MLHLEVKDLKFNNYRLTFDINHSSRVGVFGRNKEVVFELLKVLAGINNNNNAITHEDKNIFDDKDYFRIRIIMNFKNRYLSTPNPKVIHEVMKRNYNYNLNHDEFIKTNKELNLRKETEITHYYDFSPRGINYLNFSLLMALDVENVIIMNPTIEVKEKNKLDYIVEKLSNKNKFNTAILGLDNLKAFDHKLDNILILGDNDRYVYASSNDKFIVFTEEVDNTFLIFKGNRNFVYFHAFSKEELKRFDSKKMKYKIISVYELEDVL